MGVAGLVLLQSTLAMAQAISPKWECQTNSRGERSCRAIW
jgi:hypothetical protein